RGAAVSRVSEARRLRQAGFWEPILLLGGLDPDEFAEVVAQHLTPTLTDWSSAEGVAAAAHAVGEICNVQVKVDTGMTRYGAPPHARGAGRVRLCRWPSPRVQQPWSSAHPWPACATRRHRVDGHGHG